MIRVEVLRGATAGASVSGEGPELRVGRADDAQLVLTDALVSGDHARFVRASAGGWAVEDLRSTNGTVVVRGGTRRVLDEAHGRRAELADGDEVELGSGPGAVALRVTFDGDDARDDGPDATVFALRTIAELVPKAELVEKDANLLKVLYDAQKSIGRAEDLHEVLVTICDASLQLVSVATHCTVILRDDDEAASGKRDPYVPVLTRTRLAQSSPGGATGPIPITRSVFRKVISERAAVVAADAPREMTQTESLMGAQIRSTLAVPLWRADDILGVLQLDNRETVGVFSARDLDVMGVLAHNASLAVANARLVSRLRTAEERLRKENQFLKGREQERRGGGRGAAGKIEILGNSPAMQKVFHALEKVVDTRVTVLIEGETGAGKELVAASVHYRSKRRDKLFVGQNCAAITETLLESELFGHKKGAFTGAHEDKKGLFEIADGGTLFLDEVTEMPIQLQSKLLRALQEGEIRPLGATQEKKVDVRIVAATNRNLEKEVAEGRFREDLYYRLKVFPLRVPALRERREDIPILAEAFLKRFALEMGKSVGGYAQQTTELLQSYDWPGNVRELQNEVQRLVIQLDPGAFVTPDLLSPRVRQTEGLIDKVRPQKGTLKEMMDQVERVFLIEALREHGNNKTAAAKSLGITREGLHKKLRGLGL